MISSYSQVTRGDMPVVITTEKLRRGAKDGHRWLMAMPQPVVWVVLSSAMLNLASDLGNSFGSAPQFGGPLVALGTLLAFLLAFAFAALAARVLPFDALPESAWRPWLLYGSLAWVVLTGAQSIVVVASLPRAVASPASYGSDEMFYAQYNAWLVLHGQNP